MATEVLFPSIIGPFLSDHARPGLAGVAIAGFTVTFGAALAVALWKSEESVPSSCPVRG